MRAALRHPDALRQAWLIAYATTGIKRHVARMIGCHETIHRSPEWLADHEFQKGLALAEELIADRMEDEARRRALEGQRKYKFTRDGVPLLHPKMCECGHGVELHPRPSKDDRDQTRPCEHPDCTDCSDFIGEPYFEDAYSDRLLETLLKAQNRDKYGDKVEMRGMLANLDMSRLPAPVVARLADGEDPYQVLATLSTENLRLLNAGGAGEIVVEAPDDDDDEDDEDAPDEL
jgi:hypothetical protein